MNTAILPRTLERKPWDKREGVRLVDTRHGECRYPLWSAEDRSPPTERFVCGAATVGETSYCAVHKLICLRAAPDDEAHL